MAGKEAKKNGYDVKCVQEGLSLFGLLLKFGKAMTLAELQAATGISKTKTFRLLTTLESTGVLAKDRQGLYTPGTQAFLAARRILSGDGLLRILQPILREIAESLDEAVYLAKKNGNKVTMVHMVDCTQSIRVRSLVGAVLHEGSDRHYCREFPNGVIVSTGQLDPEITTVAMPITLLGGHERGFIVVVTPTFRASQERISEQIIPVLRNAVLQGWDVPESRSSAAYFGKGPQKSRRYGTAA